MSLGLEDLQYLQSSQQHLVFQDDRNRIETAGLIKSLFTMTDVGIARIEYLVENKYDRELVGHLLAMLSQSSDRSQRELKKLNSEMFCAFLKSKEISDESKLMAKEIEELKNTNATLRDTLEKCGVSVAMDNCNILTQAMALIKDQAAFDKLQAAVLCFSSPESPLPQNYTDSQSEIADSPTPCTFETASHSNRIKVDYDSAPLPPPFLTNAPEMEIYHNMLSQQQSYRQRMLERVVAD